MLATATSPPWLADHILKRFSITDCQIIRAATARPEISYKVTVDRVETIAKSSLLAEVRRVMRSYEPNAKALVFCRSHETVDDLAEKLECKPFYRDLPKDQLEKTWREFVTSRAPSVLVCTSAVGAGVDVRGIRHVWHYGMPWSLIDYAQESGRGGRDGKEAFSHILTWEKELNSESKNYTEDELRRLVGQTTECRRTIMGQVLDGRPTSCAMLRKPNLCDNCEKSVNALDAQTVVTVPRTPPPLPYVERSAPPPPVVPTRHVHPQRQAQAQRRASTSTTTKTAPPLPLTTTRPTPGVRGQRSTRDALPPQLAKRGGRTNDHTNDSRTMHRPSKSTTATNPVRATPHTNRTAAGASSVLHPF